MSVAEAAELSTARPLDDPQLIAIVNPEVARDVAAELPESLSGLLREFNAEAAPLFPPPPEGLEPPPRLLPSYEFESNEAAMLARFLQIGAPPAALVELADHVRALPWITRSYIKPAPQPAAGVTAHGRGSAPPTDADQQHLGPAPEGVDAEYAWSIDGGTGSGIQVFDLEAAWLTSHECLAGRPDQVVGRQTPNQAWRDHGTAVLGLVGATAQIRGISPEAELRCISLEEFDTARAIYEATLACRAGDIILIEWHRPGPLWPGAGEDGFIPTEWWDDEFVAIQNATSRGVIVVEPAGNGGGSLLHPIYDQAPAPGISWRSPFARGPKDSGAILVGAGAAPLGSAEPDRSRLTFSNWGEPIDAQGWGENVVTSGYGDRYRPIPDVEQGRYTGKFAGTSSGGAMVAGVLASVQGVLAAAGRPPLTFLGARQWLRATGSPQVDAPGRPAVERIGNRPDLRQLIEQMLLSP